MNEDSKLSSYLLLIFLFSILYSLLSHYPIITMEQVHQYKKINPWMASTLLLAGIIIGFGISNIPYLRGKLSPGSSVPAATIPDNTKQPEKKEQVIWREPMTLTKEQIAKLADDDPVIGDGKAPVTLVEFSDFQCPFCSRFMKLTLPLITENYIKTGKVKLVYRDFPLYFHQQAQVAAEASQCSNEQGKFLEMHDMLFNEQGQWSGNEKAADTFKTFAKKLGLKSKQFNDCLEKHKYADEVKKDLKDGSELGVNGTPGFFINGKALSGALPYDKFFKPILDAELAGKKWELQYVLQPNGDSYVTDVRVP